VIDFQGYLGTSENVRNGYEKIKVTFKVKSDALREKNKRTHPTPVEVSLFKNKRDNKFNCQEK
jgi:predicted component of type VI protein secretion system